MIENIRTRKHSLSLTHYQVVRLLNLSAEFMRILDKSQHDFGEKCDKFHKDAYLGLFILANSFVVII